MTAPVLVTALVGPLFALVLLVVVVGAMIFSRRGGVDDDLRTPPLGRAFVIGALIGAAFLALGNTLAALLGGMPVASAALAGVTAGLVSAPIVLASLLAGHATILGVALAVAINAGALTLAAEAL